MKPTKKPTEAQIAEFMRYLGSIKTDKKAKASRENGKKYKGKKA